MNIKSTTTKRYIALMPLVFVLLWSTGFLGAKYALPFIEPFYLLHIRMVAVVAILLLICANTKVSWPNGKQIGHQIVVGVLMHVGYLGGVFTAVGLGLPTGAVAIIVSTQPLLTALLAHLMLSESLLRRQWLGLGLGFISVTILVAANQNLAGPITTWGIIATLIALVSMSIAVPYQRHFGQGINFLAGTMWQYAAAAVITGLIAWQFETRIVNWDIQLILALAWLVGGLSIGAILLLMLMLRIHKAATVSGYFYMVIPVVTLEVWLLFDEPLTFTGIIAMLGTTVAVYLVTKSTASKIALTN